MSADPALIHLIAEVDRIAAALRAYLLDDVPDDDLVLLRDAEREFHRSNDTVRRWAKEEGLGIEQEGRWYLRRSLVRKYKMR